jgi:hypothetical protein
MVKKWIRFYGKRLDAVKKPMICKLLTTQQFITNYDMSIQKMTGAPLLI